MLITYTVVVCVALLLSGIFGTLFFLEQTDRIVLTDKQAFWVIGISQLSMLMAVIFIGNLCAHIANMN